MSVDPLKISLKGFYLAPDSSVVGGTRNIFSNGVMCAKVYLGFSYAAAPGDTSTVADVASWLLNNGSLRAEAGNQTDSGVPSDYGWTSYDNTDPNHGAYVYDTQILVPENAEDRLQQPGNSIWHIEYFLRAPESGTSPLNVYYRADITTYPRLTTLNTVLMTLSPHQWSFNSGHFMLRQIWSDSEVVQGAPTTATIYALEYNANTIPTSAPENFTAIYNIKKDWITQSTVADDLDYYWPVWMPAKGTKNGPIDAGRMNLQDPGPVITSWSSILTFVAGSAFITDSDAYDNVYVALLSSDGPQNFADLGNPSGSGFADFKGYKLINDNIKEEYPANYNVTIDSDLIAFGGFINTDYDSSKSYGPIVMLQEGRFTKATGWGETGPLPEQWCSLEIFYDLTTTPSTKQKCTDSFGQTFFVTIAWSNDGDRYQWHNYPVRSFQPQYWSLTAIEKV
ncbi:hypothetical protein [Budvicia diplopodorum]|uniref:hypothetical protein n=1 Tax=Budvicia diplopodorum TaxID=1119056 RepID=UPI00135AC3AD|nr:hypothetical protein [Budvicia diplopodorum]